LLVEEDKNSEGYPIEFLVPGSKEFHNLVRKVYLIRKETIVKDVLESLFVRMFIPAAESRRFWLATAYGTPLKLLARMQDYGLGTLFDSWQLKIVENGNAVFS
jgi:hypothetical protein